MGDGLGHSCAKLPALCEVCPICGEGLRFSRGWRWIDPYGLFGGDCGVSPRPSECVTCPFDERKAGLLWIGAKFYTPESFVSEAVKMGVCKRISAVPKGFETGKTWVLLAHMKAGKKKEWTKLKKGEILPLDAVVKSEDGKPLEVTFMSHDETVSIESVMRGSLQKMENLLVLKEVECPAVFYAFKPSKVEMVVTETMLKDMDPKEKERKEKQGISFFVVPDDDPDHRGTVYDKDAEAEEKVEGE